MSILKTTRTALAIAAVAAGTFAAASTAGSSTAEAKKFVIKIGHGHHFYRHRFVPLYLTSYHGGCGLLRLKALETGSPYWWHRYRVCRFY